MRARIVLLWLAGCAAALGQVNFVWDFPTNQYGAPSPFTGGGGNPTFMSAAGGSAIYAPTVSGVNANDYEMRTVLAATQGLAGGTYMHFLRASSNAAPGVGSCVGSYISVEFALPSGWQNGGAAQLTVNQCVNGTYNQLLGTSAAIHNGDALRSVVWGTTLWVFVNNVRYVSQTIPQTTGQPGYGGRNNPSPGLASPLVGHHDVASPLALQPHTLATSVLTNAASFKWSGVADDALGIGVYEYSVSRNGVAMTNLVEPIFTDATVQPSTTYAYSFTATDFHGNSSTPVTINITTPAANLIDPRRTGIYTTGSYWGGGGEQIDTLSGNLNFSLPLATAVGRAGTQIPVGLVYNSQNWRQDNGVNWNLGADVGFGYGWQMLIGSITPYHTDFLGDVDHYVYTDATGAQYLLNVNTGGVWSSKQSVYVWFDSNANKLHFRDGSFWVMGCTSGGGKPMREPCTRRSSRM